MPSAADAVRRLRPVVASCVDVEFRLLAASSPYHLLGVLPICNRMPSMKTASIPEIRVEPQLLDDIESVLKEGETLAEFVEATVRRGVEYRLIEDELRVRRGAASEKAEEERSVDDVLADLQAKVDSTREWLSKKHGPAAE